MQPLSDEEKRRIRDEEIFRAEVREALAKTQEKRGFSRVLSFFNTGLGLWLLSTLVVGGITFAYARFQESMKGRNERAAYEQKLNGEIAGRVRSINQRLTSDAIKLRRSLLRRQSKATKSVTLTTEQNTVFSMLVTQIGIDLESKDPEDTGTFPEFKTLSLVQTAFIVSTVDSKYEAGFMKLQKLADASQAIRDLDGPTYVRSRLIDYLMLFENTFAGLPSEWR